MKRKKRERKTRKKGIYEKKLSEIDRQTDRWANR